MKFAVIICVLCCLIAANEAADALFYDSANPGKCTIDKDHVLSVGQKMKAPHNPCAAITCLENSKVKYEICKPVAPPEGCRQRGFVDTSLEYPKCCPREYECKKN